MIRTKVLAASVLLALAGSTLCATPPTDEQVGAALTSFNAMVKDLDRTDREAYQKAHREAAVAAIKDLSIGEMTASQIKTASMILSAAGKSAEVNTRLEALSREKSADGLLAATLLLERVPYVNPRSEQASQDEARAGHRAALKAVLTHPGFADAMKSGEAAGVFSALGRIDDAVVAEFAPQIAGLAAYLTADAPTTLAQRVRTLVQVVAENDAFTPQQREAIRTKALAVVQRAGADATDEKMKTSFDRSARYIDGAFARGELIGKPLPTMNVIWASEGAPKSFADLKGKVVVVDFWATWCGPCVVSFPDVKKLQAHYEGYPVVILGVTSIQGRHISRPEGAQGKTVTMVTEGNPDQEFALMPEFMKQLDMTWPVVFTEQDVFNPDFGVLGIPHVGIIDPAGVVRFRALHPSSGVTPWEEKTGKIDALLAEFHLPAPPAAAAEETPKAGG